MNTPLLQMIDIEKAFFGVPVLRGVSLTLSEGQTLGLVGENGAGKSTLMNILGGILPADAGEITLGGQRFAPHTPRDAETAGVAFIHQELNLFPNLTIAENLFLTHFPRRWWWGIDRRTLHQRASDLLRQVGLDYPPHVRVESLSAGERQLVEIAKALNLKARLIILDEPTTSLAEREAERLFQLLRSLQSQGLAMIYISHALGDVSRLCHEVVVLRDGQVAGSGPMRDLTTSRLVQLMVGRQVDQQFPDRTSRPQAEVLLDVRGVTQPGIVHQVSFSLHRGEVLGIAGLMGSGRTELARILFGLDPLRTGTIELCGQPIQHLSTRRRIQRGMALLTENRRDDGLCMEASIHENMALVTAPQHTRPACGWLREDTLTSSIASMRESVRLTASARSHQPVRTLSGGNQQKVVLGKWLLNNPQVLILDEPTRGIDVGAKYEMYGLMDRLAAGGAGVLVISSELDELIGLCDRILVMSQGGIRDVVKREAFDRQRILHAALHADANGGAA